MLTTTHLRANPSLLYRCDFVRLGVLTCRGPHAPLPRCTQRDFCSKWCRTPRGTRPASGASLRLGGFKAHHTACLSQVLWPQTQRECDQISRECEPWVRSQTEKNCLVQGLDWTVHKTESASKIGQQSRQRLGDGGNHRERRYPTVPRAQSTTRACVLTLYSSADCPVVVCHARRVACWGAEAWAWMEAPCTVRAPPLRWRWPGVGPPRCRCSAAHIYVYLRRARRVRCAVLVPRRASHKWIAPTSAACSVRCIRAVCL